MDVRGQLEGISSHRDQTHEIRVGSSSFTYEAVCVTDCTAFPYIVKKLYTCRFFGEYLKLRLCTRHWWMQSLSTTALRIKNSVNTPWWVSERWEAGRQNGSAWGVGMIEAWIIGCSHFPYTTFYSLFNHHSALQVHHKLHNIAAHLGNDYFQKSYQQVVILNMTLCFQVLWKMQIYGYSFLRADCLLLYQKSNKIPPGNRTVKSESLRQNSDFFKV